MIAKKIDELRKQKHYTLKELASEIGITLSGIQKALKTDDFKLSQLNKIAEVLGVDISYFFDNRLTEDGYSFLNLRKVQYEGKVDYENAQIKELFYKICIKQAYDYFVIEKSKLIYDIIKDHKSIINNKSLKKYLPYLEGKKDSIYDTGDISDLMSILRISLTESHSDSYGVDSDINKVMTSINKSFIKQMSSNRYIKWLLKDNLVEEEEYIFLITSVTCNL